VSGPWKVVLDTNIWVSAALMPDGLRAKVIQVAKGGGFRVISSVWIHSEIVSVLKRPRIRAMLGPGVDALEWLEDVEARCAILLSDPQGPAVSVDPKDDPFLWAAYESGADWLVSADVDLLRLKHFHGTQIATPKDFLSHWRRAQ
jgi:putative PIN family toxin of toxin-antitoxin system